MTTICDTLGPQVSTARSATALDGLDEAGREALSAEVEQALGSRIRHTVLSRRLSALYSESSRRHRQRVARAWLTGATFVNIGAIAFDYLFYSPLLGPSLLLRGLLGPIVYSLLACVWLRPRRAWIEGSTLPAAVFATMVIAGVLGLVGGESTLNRYLDAGLFGTISAIVVFPVGIRWTIMGGLVTIGLYVGFGLLDPVIAAKDTFLFAGFFSLVIGSLIPARQGINATLQRAFLLNLRGLLQSKALETVNARLSVLANTDGLTGLPNRRAFDAEADRLWQAADPEPRCLGIVLLDLDHFKRLNDTAGHAAGDRCLMAMAETIRAAVSGGAMAARYGGEEFICVFGDATPRGLELFAESLRADIEAMSWSNPGLGEGRTVTVSIGLAIAVPDRQRASLDALIRSADTALYWAKANGRNRAVATWNVCPVDARLAAPTLAERICA